MRRREPIDERLQTVEIGDRASRRSRRQSSSAPGCSFIDPGLNEVRLIEQVGPEAQQFGQLGQRQLPVDRERAEGLSVRRLQVFIDEPRQVCQIGPLEPLQQAAPPFPVQFDAGEPVERRILEVVEPRPVVQRMCPQRVAADRLWIECRRQIRRGPDDFALMVEAQAEPVADVLQRLLGIAIVRRAARAGSESRSAAPVCPNRSCHGPVNCAMRSNCSVFSACRQW